MGIWQGERWQKRLERSLTAVQSPREGWWTLLLLWAIVRLVGVAVETANWTAEATAVPRITMWSLFLTFLIARLVQNPVRGWLLIGGYGLMVPFLTMARLWPNGFFQPPSRLNLLTFLFRVEGWWQGVSSGGGSNETAVFTLGLLILSWLLVAYLVWTTIRGHRPINAILLTAVALSLNAYFADIRLYLLYFFAIFSVTLLASRQTVLEGEWRKNDVEFASTIGQRVWQTVAGVMVGLFVAALLSQSLSSYRLALAFYEWPPVRQLEGWLDASFGGVNSSRGVAAQPVSREGSVLPRSYLLGNAPELYEIVVMTATVEVGTDPPRQPLHWRAISYDVYSGRGWRRTDGVEDVLPANTAVTLPPLQATTTVSQTVNWVLDGRSIRYTLGQPLQFADDVVLHRQPGGSLVWVEGEQRRYTAVTRASSATSAQLNLAQLDDVPPDLLRQYTQLPETLPQRVHELAQEITADYQTPYARAKAIEQFLHQYPYSLELPPPPTDQDVVDFFLFDLQAGYCDYYASAMVTLARSIGLPARLSSGFITQPPNEDGVQTIYQIDGHSWAEVYFAGYGWIEFEPTAGFLEANGAETAVTAPNIKSEPLPLPRRGRPFLQLLGVLLAGVALTLAVGWWLTQLRRERRMGIVGAYDEMIQFGQRLGLDISSASTPAEAAHMWQKWLRQQQSHPWVSEHRLLLDGLDAYWGYVRQVVRGYVKISYEKEKGGVEKRPLTLWQRRLLHTLMRLLTLRQT